MVNRDKKNHLWDSFNEATKRDILRIANESKAGRIKLDVDGYDSSRYLAIYDYDSTIWRSISEVKGLSEDFIREFKDYVDWGVISICQKLSEDFIREFKDRVDWRHISSHQELSESFIREFKHKVSVRPIYLNYNISESLIEELIAYDPERNYADLATLAMYRELSANFIMNFKKTPPSLVLGMN